jgi:hypothetical protein
MAATKDRRQRTKANKHGGHSIGGRREAPMRPQPPGGPIPIRSAALSPAVSTQRQITGATGHATPPCLAPCTQGVLPPRRLCAHETSLWVRAHAATASCFPGHSAHVRRGHGLVDAAGMHGDARCVRRRFDAVSLFLTFAQLCRYEHAHADRAHCRARLAHIAPF